MAQLATVATIASTAAGIAQSTMQGQAARKAEAAQQTAQTAALQAQASERARQRRDLLERTVASARARLAAGGASPDSGSGAALVDGLRAETAQAQDADNQQLAARMAAGRRSLLSGDGTLSTFTRAVRGSQAVGSGLRSLLDAF